MPPASFIASPLPARARPAPVPIDDGPSMAMVTSAFSDRAGCCHGDTHHVHGAENVAVVVAGLQVLGNVGKCTQVLRVLCSARNVPDLMLSNDILPGKMCSGTHSPRASL